MSGHEANCESETLTSPRPNSQHVAKTRTKRPRLLEPRKAKRSMEVLSDRPLYLEATFCTYVVQNRSKTPHILHCNGPQHCDEYEQEDGEDEDYEPRRPRVKSVDSNVGSHSLSEVRAAIGIPAAKTLMKEGEIHCQSSGCRQDRK